MLIPTPGQRWVSYWREYLANLVFPPDCLSCQASGSWWCEACRTSATVLPLDWCGTCDRRAKSGTTLCKRCGERLNLTSLISCFPYEGSVEQLIQAIKFRPAAIGLEAIVDHSVVAERLLVPSQTWLIPLPSASENEAKRGFNQAALIAQQIAQRSGAVVVDGLQRTRTSRPQVGLSATDRWTNVQDLYRWTGGPLNRQRCVLVDDVVTTGASVAAASAALHDAGARAVTALTIAQTPPSHPQGAA